MANVAHDHVDLCDICKQEIEKDVQFTDYVGQQCHLLCEMMISIKGHLDRKRTSIIKYASDYHSEIALEYVKERTNGAIITETVTNSSYYDELYIVITFSFDFDSQIKSANKW